MKSQTSRSSGLAKVTRNSIGLRTPISCQTSPMSTTGVMRAVAAPAPGRTGGRTDCRLTGDFFADCVGFERFTGARFFAMAAAPRSRAEVARARLVGADCEHAGQESSNKSLMRCLYLCKRRSRRSAVGGPSSVQELRQRISVDTRNLRAYLVQ